MFNLQFVTRKLFFCRQRFLKISLNERTFPTLENARKSRFQMTFFLLQMCTTSWTMDLEKAEYFKVFNLFVIIFVISLLLFSIAYFLSLSVVKDSEKLSQYECGFEPFDEATRHPFDVHFYIVGILFLIFDVEVALLFPWVIGLKFLNIFGFFTMAIFLIILTIGFFYEWHRGALIWPHKQTKF